MYNNSNRLGYLNAAILYLIQNQFVLFLLGFIDFLSVYSFFIIAVDKVKNGLGKFSEENEYFFYISPYNYLKKYVNTSSNLYITIFMIIILIFFLLYELGLLLFTPKLANNAFVKIFKKIHANLYELFFFRFFSLFTLDVIITLIVKLIYSSYDEESNLTSTFFSIFVLLMVFIVVFVGSIYHFSINVVWSNMKLFNSSMKYYPFDMKYSFIYDLIFISIKVLISIDKNVYLFSNKEINSHILLFICSALLAIYIYFIYLLYSIFYSENKTLYLPLTKIAIFRIFAINFIGFSTIYKFIISDNVKYIFYFFTGASMIFFIFFYFEQFPRYMMLKFSRANDLVGILFFLINNDVNHTQCITNWIMNHKIKCRKKICFICENINTKFANTSIDNISLKNFFHFIYECTLNEINKLKTKIDKETEINLDIIELMDLLLTNNNQRIKFYVIFYKKLLKYKKSNKSVLFNLYIMFQKVNELNADFIKSYESFIESESILKIFNKFFDDFENFMRFEIKNPMNIIKLSNKLYVFTKNQQVIKFLSQNVSNYSYEFLLLRYIFEAITHKPLLNNYEFFDISQFTDFLNYHWENDHFLLINYGLLAQNCVIVKSSCDIRKYINLPFESLFPRYIKSYGKNVFVKELNSNNFKDENNIFEYVVNNLNNIDYGYVESFKMKFVMYPSIDTGEMLITGDFTYKDSCIVIFDIVNEKELLVSYSEKLKDFFVLSPVMIEDLSINQKNFEFCQIFKKRNLTSNTTKFKETSNFVFQFNYDSYYHLLNFFLDEASDIKNREEIIEQLSKNQNIIENKIFIIKKTETIECKGEKYKIYYLNTENFMRQGNTRKSNNSDDCNMLIDDKLNTQTFTKYMTQTGTESVSLSSSSEGNRNRLRLKTNDKDKSNLKDQAKFKKIKLFIKLMMVCHLLLISLSIIFIILQIIRTIDFGRLFELYQKFKFFKRGLDIELLRLSSNYCFQLDENDKSENPKCQCYYTLYSQGLQTTNIILGNDKLINQIIYEEFKASVDLVKSQYIEYTEKLYKLSNNKINTIESFSVDMLFITENGNGITLTKNTETILNAVNLYINYLSQVINRDKLLSTPIKFFTLSSDLQITNVNLGTPNEDQRLIYQLLINFPFMQKILLKTQSLIQSWFNGYLKELKLYLTIFSCLIGFFSIVLALSKMFFIWEFTIMLNRKFRKIHKKIFSSDFIKYFHSKFIHLKSLLSLYEKRPSEEIGKLTKEKEEYKKLMIEQKKEKIQLPPEVKKKMKKKDTIDYRPFIKKYKMSIIIIYLSYCLVYIILYFIMTDSLEHLEDLVQYSNLNADIDNYLNNNLNSLQFMSTTNSTESQLGEYIYDDPSIEFVTDSISNHLYSMKLIETLKAKHEHLFGTALTRDNLTCSEMKDINDTYLYLLYKNGASKEELDEFIVDMCNSYPIMKFNDQSLVMQNIIYLEQKILNRIFPMPYQARLYLQKSDEIYELYGLILILNSVLRGYLNEICLPDITQKLIGNYKMEIGICLGFNSICLITLMILQHYFVAMRLVVVNEKLNLLLKFLE